LEIAWALLLHELPGSDRPIEIRHGLNDLCRNQVRDPNFILSTAFPGLCTSFQLSVHGLSKKNDPLNHCLYEGVTGLALKKVLVLVKETGQRK
jgi:hypothetical protein